MIIVYLTICEQVSDPVRFSKNAAENASFTSHALRDTSKVGASSSVWLVPGTWED